MATCWDPAAPAPQADFTEFVREASYHKQFEKRAAKQRVDIDGDPDITLDALMVLESSRTELVDIGAETKIYCNGLSRWRFCTRQLALVNPQFRYWYPSKWHSSIDSFLDKHRKLNIFIWTFTWSSVEDDYGRTSKCKVARKIVFIVALLLLVAAFGVVISVLQSLVFLAYLAAFICHLKNVIATEIGNCVHDDDLNERLNALDSTRTINHWQLYALNYQRLVCEFNVTINSEHEARLHNFNVRHADCVDIDGVVPILVVGDRFMSLYRWAILKSLCLMCVIYAITIFVVVMVFKHFKFLRLA